MLLVLFCPVLPNGLAAAELLLPGEKSELPLAPPKRFDDPEVPDVCPKIDLGAPFALLSDIVEEALDVGQAERSQLCELELCKLRQSIVCFGRATSLLQSFPGIIGVWRDDNEVSEHAPSKMSVAMGC